MSLPNTLVSQIWWLGGPLDGQKFAIGQDVEPHYAYEVFVLPQEKAGLMQGVTYRDKLFLIHQDVHGTIGTELVRQVLGAPR